MVRQVAFEERPVTRELGRGGRDAMTMADDFDAPLDDFADDV